MITINIGLPMPTHAGLCGSRRLRQLDADHGERSSLRSASRWQRLYFRPLPHQQGSLRPSLWLAPAITDGVTAVSEDKDSIAIPQKEQYGIFRR